jgi:hypothetical protein
MIAEPLWVYPEEVFQRAVVELIRVILKKEQRENAVLQGFGLDIAVFLEAAQSTNVRFIEVKAFGSQRPGAVGFGSKSGGGMQVDLLLCGVPLSLFDPTVRWAYADATQDSGSSRYALFTSTAASGIAMGKQVARGKQNNLRVSGLRDLLVDWPQFCSQVRQFLLA